MADFSRDYRVTYDVERKSCTITFRCFDTPNSVTAYVGDFADYEIENVLLDVRRLCLELHALWSFSLEESDIARINAQTREPVPVDIRTARLLQEMKAFHGREPLFDFTIGSASFIWKHFDRVPDDRAVEEALSHVGVDKVSVAVACDEDGGEVPPFIQKSDSLTRVDVGGAAKGFAADLVAARLREAGIKSADVDLGGNLFLVGKHPAGRPWRLSVRIPEGIEADRIVVEVEDVSAVTSGSYERFVEVGGKRYQHIVDPATGRPSTSDIVSATVIAKSSLQADMLATTLLMSGSGGYAGMLARHPECDFIAILQDGTVMRSS